MLIETNGLCGFPGQFLTGVSAGQGEEVGTVSLGSVVRVPGWLPGVRTAPLSVAHVRRRGACTRQSGDRAPSSADREFIEARRRALKRFINLVARHPPFSEDVVLKLFLAFSGPVST